MEVDRIKAYVRQLLSLREDDDVTVEEAPPIAGDAAAHGLGDVAPSSLDLFRGDPGAWVVAHVPVQANVVRHPQLPGFVRLAANGGVAMQPANDCSRVVGGWVELDGRSSPAWATGRDSAGRFAVMADAGQLVVVRCTEQHTFADLVAWSPPPPLELATLAPLMDAAERAIGRSPARPVFDAARESFDPIERAAAAGLVARLWRPESPRSTNRSDAVAALVRSVEAGPDSIAAAARALGDDTVGTLAALAEESAGRLLDELRLLDDEPGLAPSVVPAATERRDALESVAWLLAQRGADRALRHALMQVDDAAAELSSTLSAIELPETERWRDARWTRPEAWWMGRGQAPP